MLGITRYIIGQLLSGLVLTSFGLACLLLLTQSLRFVELIVNKGLSVGGFMMLTVMLLPNLLVYILPISLFVVVLFVYNRMISDRELVVLRAAGLSHLALARPALTLAVLVTLVGYGITLVMSPLSNQAFREYYWQVRHDLSSVLILEGSFNQLGQGLTIYVGHRSGSGVLEDVLVHDSRDPARALTIMAQGGRLTAGEHGPEVLLENGNRQEVTGTGQMSMLYFDRYTVQFNLASGGGDQRAIDPRERPLNQLLTAEAGKEFSAGQIRQFRVEAHQRLVMPLLHLAFALIPLACLLSGSFNRRGQAGRVVLAIALMVLVQAGAVGGANLAAKFTRLVPLMYVNALVPVVACLIVLAGLPLRRLQAKGKRRAALA
jgi:lipopolysaccharide export system permease protein